MAANVSWGTRRALGRRYSVDPALQLEAERLQQEYNLVPGREARALQASQFQQSLEQQKERDEQAGKSGMVGTAGNLVTTGMMLRAMQGKSILPSFSGSASGTGAGSVTAPVEAAKLGTNTSPALIDSAYGAGGGATGFNAAASDAAYSGAVGAGAEAGGVGTVPIAAGAEGGASLAGGMSAAGAAAPYAAAGYIAAKLGGSALERIAGGRESSNVFAKMGRTIQDPLAGIGKPWLRETGNLSPTLNTVMDVLNPVGWVAGKSGCIIVTACTDRYSPEVRIARAYRDRFLDADSLRGYYYLAEQIVPFLERNKTARKMVKKWLVDRLVDYGAYRLGKNMMRPRWSSYVVSKAFLATIKAIGMILPVYVRANGEVY